LLVVVDNSNSMEQEQALLTTAFPELIRALVTGDINADGTAEFIGAMNVHIGVVTTDMGTAGYAIPTCSEPTFGDDGVLRTAGDPGDGSCSATYPKVLDYRAGGALSALRADFTCVATVGIGGCGFEQQLEAALEAVTPAGSVTRFFMDTTGHADGANSGFLRTDSIVVILVVTDEEDCSVEDPDFFNPASMVYFGSLNNRCVTGSGGLYGIPRYAEGFRALRPGAPHRVIFAGLVGIPLDLEGATYDIMLDDPDMQYIFDVGSVLRPSCNDVGRGVAYAPRRIVRAAQELSRLGSGTLVRSICRDDCADFFTALLGQIQPVLESSCP